MNVLTKDAMGKILFTTMSAFVEFEAKLLSESIKKGLEASLPEHKKREIKILYAQQRLQAKRFAEQTGVSRSSIYRIIKRRKFIGT